MNFMPYLIAFGLAYFFSFLGMIPPGMISMNGIAIRCTKGLKSAFLFVLGASIVEFFQSFISIRFADTISTIFVGNDFVQWSAVVLFILIAIYYYTKRTNPTRHTVHSKDAHSYFLKGTGLSLLNFIVYPYWLTQGIIFMKNGLLINKTSVLLTFSFGAFLGTLSCLVIYIKVGQIILDRYDNISANIYKIIASIFLLLATVQLWYIYSQKY